MGQLQQSSSRVLWLPRACAATPDCSSVLRRNVASMALQASLAFSSPTSPSLLSLRVARSLLAATPSPTPLPSPGQIRFKRVNIQKPRRPDWFRQQLLAVAAPRYSPPQTIEELPDSCEMAEKEEERREWKEHINQLEKFYVQEMVEMFEKSEMIAFFHTNPIKEADWRKAWQVRLNSQFRWKTKTKWPQQSAGPPFCLAISLAAFLEMSCTSFSK